MALSDQQRRFCEGVVAGLSHVDAYLAAGYQSSGKAAESSASRLLRNAKVAEYVEELRQKAIQVAEQSTGVSKAWVIDMLRKNVERAMQAEPVFDSEGKPTGEYRYAGNVANRALELIGKTLNMFGEGGVPAAAAPGRRTVRYVRDEEIAREVGK